MRSVEDEEADYDYLLGTFEVEVLVKVVDDDMYEGYTRVLVRDGGRYGLLIIGWGSCSGCDALAACEEDIVKLTALREQLWGEVHWEISADAMLRYLREKDWEAAVCSETPETVAFVRQACEAMVDAGARVG